MGKHQDRQNKIIEELGKGDKGKTDAELKALTEEYNDLQAQAEAEQPRREG